MLQPGTIPHTALLAAISGTVAFSVDIALPALPVLAEVFATRPETAQLTIGLFLAGLSVGIIVVGPLADRFGRRPMVLLGMTIFVLGGIASTLAPSIEILILARLVQGFGAAAGRVLAPAIIRDNFAGPRGAQLLSRMMLFVGLAPMLAPMIASVLLEFLPWRAVFGGLTAFGMAVLLGVTLGLTESLKAPDPDALQPRRLFANWRRFFATRACIANAGIQSGAFGAMYAYISGSAFVLIQGFGVSPFVYSALFASTALMMMAGNSINSRSVRRRGIAGNRRLGTAIALVAGTLGVVIASLQPSGAFGVVATMAPVWLFMCGNGLILPNTTAGVMEPHPDMAGVSSALLGALQMTGGVIVGFAVTRFFDGSAMSMAAAMAVLGAIAFAVDRLALPPPARS